MTADAQMLQRDEIDEERTAEVDEQWRQSLLDVMRQVVNSLPDETTLGELVAATRGNPHLAPMLGYMSVQELIDMAVARPVASVMSGRAGLDTGTNGGTTNGRRSVSESEIEYDEDGNPLMDLPDAGPAVIRRRADVPDGDLRILRTLADEGPSSEPSLLRATKLTSEQIKLVLRHLRAKGFVHVEGSGQKRKIKITRNGAAQLRKLSRKPR
jgi:predicted transcriptional regulator